MWSLKIIRNGNGYTLKGNDGFDLVIQEDEKDELKDHEELLWEIMNYFNFGGSKHDARRIKIIIEEQKE